MTSGLDPDLLAAIGPRVRKSPFFDRTVEAGLAKVSTYNHMWLPMGYGDPEAEYRRLTEGVSMWDVAAQRHIQVAGPDADALVALVTVIDTTTTDRGTATYAPMVDDDGVLINDPILIRLHDGTWRFSIADRDVDLWLRAIVRERGLSVEVGELDTATLAVQGPRSAEVAARLGFDWWDDLDDMHHRSAEINGLEVLVSRTGWSHQGGFELFLDDPSGADALWRAVADAGRAVDIGPGAPNPAERIESTLLSFGTDTGDGANPYEMRLGGLVAFDAGEFIGRDALRHIADRGPERWLLGCVIDGEPVDVLPHPMELLSSGERRGELRAAVYSPRWQRNIGLGLMDASCAPGDVATVQFPADTRRVELVDLPFDLP